MPPPDALFDFPPITGFGGVRGAIHVRGVPNPNLMAIRQRTTVEIDDREYRPRPDLYTAAVEGIAGSGCDILAAQHAEGHSPLRWLVGAYIDTRVEHESRHRCGEGNQDRCLCHFHFAEPPVSSTLAVYGYSTLKSSLRGQQFPSTTAGD